jgi:molybdopterin-dependent oxidoreductase alpha subunit
MSDPRITAPKTTAVGLPAVLSSLGHAASLAGPLRGARALATLNQVGGVDCPSCAWPDPADHRSTAEFCENGAKAVAWEADRRRLTPADFARLSIADLDKLSDYEHGQLGRLTHPMVRRPGAAHYAPISWADAFRLIADELHALPSPDAAAFYTSGRASNEAAFLWQLLARRLGTNNLPDCSNMCHESSGAALSAAVGIGKGTVRLADFPRAAVVLVLGQNPGTNHPRMLTALQQTKRAGGSIVAVNPLKEAGLLAFRNPQEPAQLLGLTATPLADDYLQVRVGGDQALLQGVMKSLVERGAVDRGFIAAKTTGFDALEAHLGALDWAALEGMSGLPKARMAAVADRLAGTDRIIACWAMGLTQHKHAVATIADVANLLLLRGAIGKPGAGLCPVRGHSNVQGDRTMGVWEKPPAWAASLGERFGFAVPVKVGLDTVATIKAMAAGDVRAFLALGGNFLQAAPDTAATAAALQRCSLTAHVAVKLNRSHLVTGRTGLLLPCLGRTEIDRRPAGEQFVTTENSMGVVQMSRGRLEPASEHLRSEPAVVAGIAAAVLPPDIPWQDLADDYDRIRDLIAATVPGCADYNRLVRQPGGFELPNPPRDGDFPAVGGRARFTLGVPTAPAPGPGQLILQTLRSHDQFNTTVYGLDDRYRGVKGGRMVLFVNPADLAARGLRDGDVLDVTSHFGGETRTATGFRAVAYDLPAGCCAAYFPEANALVPLDSVADASHTPTSKCVFVTLAAVTRTPAGPRTARTR